MTSYNIPTGNLYKDWTTEMEATIGNESMKFIEQLYNSDLNVGLTARTLTVMDIPAFEKATKTDIKDFKTFLTEKNDKGNLNIEHLQRLCERYGIRYDLTGDRPATAHRKYIKQQRDTTAERQSKANNLCGKAMRRTIGSFPGVPKNTEQAISLLKEAISLGYLPAYAQLAKVYKNEGMDKEAMATAEKGSKLGDAKSMIWLAQWLREAPYNDYSRAAKLFITASEKGRYAEASKGLYQLITKGYFTPKGDMYMKLILCVARDRKRIAALVENNPLLDPELRQARRILLNENPDIQSARETLNEALGKGKFHSYGGLATCDILEKRWGQASENVLKGIETGDITCLKYATRLALMGADFVNFTDELGQPDYKATLEWCKRCIDEDILYGFQMLYHLADIGQLKMKDIESPELVERCSYYLDNTTEEERADIYLRPFDGKRQPKTETEK